MNFKGKHILITGGNSGIGRATAYLAAKNGAHVSILALDPAKNEAVLKELKVHGGNHQGFICDVSDLHRLKKVFSDITDEGRRPIDILINNAGYATYHTFAELTLDEIDHMTRVNYMGALYLCKLAADQMVSNRGGHIINVSSVAGKLPVIPNLVYGAAKHALVALTDLLRYEYSDKGVEFSSVLPGRVRTPFFDHPSFRSRSPRPENSKMLEPEEVANAILNQALKKGRSIVLPKRFVPVIWLHGALPAFTALLFGFLMKKRLRQHAADLKQSESI